MPPSWSGRELAPNYTEVVVDSDASIRIRSQVALPPDYGFWIDHVMKEDVPVDCQAVLRGELEHLRSEQGWPVVLARYEVRLPSHEIVEERVGVFYRILHDGAEVVARCRGSWLTSRFPELRAILLGGRVIWPTNDAVLLYTLLGMDT
ncbi:MAG: hypothetical protein ACTHU0_20725 [Kofleriaceae bacterium]